MSPIKPILVLGAATSSQQQAALGSQEQQAAKQQSREQRLLRLRNAAKALAQRSGSRWIACWDLFLMPRLPCCLPWRHPGSAEIHSKPQYSRKHVAHFRVIGAVPTWQVAPSMTGRGTPWNFSSHTEGHTPIAVIDHMMSHPRRMPPLFAF